MVQSGAAAAAAGQLEGELALLTFLAQCRAFLGQYREAQEDVKRAEGVAAEVAAAGAAREDGGGRLFDHMRHNEVCAPPSSLTRVSLSAGGGAVGALDDPAPYLGPL